MPKVERAIIMAAGLGNRMHPVTLTTPKPLVKVNGVRMIDTVIDGLHENEIYENSITQKNVVFVNEKGKKEKHLFNEFKSIEFIDLKGKERIFERPIEKYGLFELIYEAALSSGLPQGCLFQAEQRDEIAEHLQIWKNR